MSTTDTTVQNLIINTLNKAQFEGITPSDTELYLVTDDFITSTEVTTALGYTPYNATNPDGFISSAAIASLTDVALTGLADGQILKYNSTTQKWENSAASGGGTWGSITGTLSDQTDLQTALNGKQATLVSGTNIKTINSTSLLGSGDVSVQPTLVSGTNIKTINSTSLLGSGDISVQPTITSSAMLSSDLVDDTNKTHKFATSAQLTQIATNTTDISTINGKIPAQATSSNQLADKAFVNSSVQTATANFRGNWDTWALVPTSASSYPADYAGSTTPTVNDYLVVQDASDYTGDTLEGTWRFKYSGTWATDGKNGWLPEYQVNETPLTATQLAALNSGITSSDVTLIGTALQPGDLKTVNNVSIIGSGNIDIDSLPSQTGQSGKFLTTDGTDASWASISIPSKISDLTDDTATYPVDKADTLTGLTASITELNYVDGVTSAIQTQLNGKQDSTTAVTHTASTAVGSGTQPVYIASDGTATATTYSLAKSVPADAVFTDTTYSAFTGATGSAAGTSGLVPAPTATDNTKYLKGDGTWAEISGSADIDNLSITQNSSDELQTVGVIDQNNTTNAIKTWTGTKAQYDAIVTKDAATLYNITDDTNTSLSLLELLYPVGSLYIATSNVSACPLQTLGVGTWQLKSNATLVTNVDSTASVVGNGMALGLTDGTNNAGVLFNSQGMLEPYTGSYGASVGSGYSGSSIKTVKTGGVTTDPTKSGLEATVTTTTLAVAIWERVS